MVKSAGLFRWTAFMGFAHPRLPPGSKLPPSRLMDPFCDIALDAKEVQRLFWW